MTDKEARKLAQAEAERWFSDSCMKDIEHDYLNKDSLVVDFGGYKGDWAAKIFANYDSIIHIYEPIPEFYEQLRERFKVVRNRIILHAYGVDSVAGSIPFSICGDATSGIMYAEGRLQNSAVLDVNYILRRFSTIDLLSINIEGMEYAVLERLIGTSLIHYIKNIQVQFHPFVSNCYERRERIAKVLSQTHDLTYRYDFVWENWKLKNSSI